MSSNVNDLQARLSANQIQLNNLNENIVVLKQEKEAIQLKLSEVNLINSGLKDKIVKLEHDYLQMIRDREWQLLSKFLQQTFIINDIILYN